MERPVQIAVTRFGVNFFMGDEIQVTVTKEDIATKRVLSTYWLSKVALEREEAEAQGLVYVEPDQMILAGRIVGFEPDVPAHDDEERFIIIKQELEGNETEFFQIEFNYFLQLIDQVPPYVVLMTKPLFHYGVSYTNRFTGKASKFVFVTPGRDSETGQYMYAIETVHGDGRIEYDFQAESALLKAFNSTEFIETFL